MYVTKFCDLPNKQVPIGQQPSYLSVHRHQQWPRKCCLHLLDESYEINPGYIVGHLFLTLPEATHMTARMKRSAILHNRFMMLPADSSNESKLSPMYESLSF